jgi:hypothetical protein
MKSPGNQSITAYLIGWDKVNDENDVADLAVMGEDY